MVRNYQKKNTKVLKYNSEDLTIAIQLVTTGRKTIYRASKDFKIPYTTIYSHLKGLTRSVRMPRSRVTSALIPHANAATSRLVHGRFRIASTRLAVVRGGCILVRT